MCDDTYLFFYFNSKEKGGRRPPSKIILCLCFCAYYFSIKKCPTTFILRNVIFQFLIPYIETILKIFLPLFYYFFRFLYIITKIKFLFILYLLFYFYFLIYKNLIIILKIVIFLPYFSNSLKFEKL